MSELEELPSWAGRSTEKVDLTGPPEAPETAEATDQPETEPAPPQTSGQHEAEPEATAAEGGPELPIVPADSVGDGGRRDGRPGWTKALLALLAVAVLVGVGALGYLLASARNSTETATAGEVGAEAGAVRSEETPEEPVTEADATADGTTAADGGTGTGDETDQGTTDADTMTVEVDPDAEDAGAAEDAAAGSVTDLNDGNRQAFFRGGKVYLTGAVPSEQIAQIIVEKAAAVVGPDNVVNQYTIDPTVEIPPGDSAPLYVEDVVLFEFNSIAIAEPFLPLLDLGVLLLVQNPQASMTVVTRTDAVGTEAVNLVVATRRGEAVRDYLVGNGVDPDQIDIDPRGEEGTSDDDDAETAARQRRAEFIITGLLD
jgi:outer membrane protein OmpA-like peptidoglycan-associated protein